LEENCKTEGRNTQGRSYQGVKAAQSAAAIEEIDDEH
jgi:hypothetical protein